MAGHVKMQSPNQWPLNPVFLVGEPTCPEGKHGILQIMALWMTWQEDAWAERKKKER